MGTIIVVIVVAVALLVLAALVLPKGPAIRSSLSRYLVLGDLSGAVEKAQPRGQVKNVSLEVIYDEGRFRIEVVDDTSTREVVAQRRGRFEVAVSYIPRADYSPTPTFALVLERSSITDDPSLNRKEVKGTPGTTDSRSTSEERSCRDRRERCRLFMLHTTA